MYIQWEAGLATKYRVRVNWQNAPNQGIAWDSGEVNSKVNFAWPPEAVRNILFTSFGCPACTA